MQRSIKGKMKTNCSLLFFIIGVIFISGCAPEEIVEEPQQEIAAPIIKEKTEVAEEAAQKIPIEQPKTPEPDRSPGSEYALSNLKKGLRERGVTDCRETYPQLSTDNTFVIDPSDSNILYIGVSYYGMFKSIDGGATWKAINNGILFYPNDKEQLVFILPFIDLCIVCKSSYLRRCFFREDFSFKCSIIEHLN